jgi:hypothetical protein
MDCVSLESISQITSGSTVIRGGRDSHAVMVSDLDGSGKLGASLTLMGAPKSGLVSALRINDVVISLRGNTNFAAVIGEDDLRGLALFATLDLAIIRIGETQTINPDYVVTWLNLPSTQAILAESREGTAAKRLPLGPLKALQIPLPSWQRQSAIVALARDVADERRIASRIAQLRTTLFNACLAQAAMKESAL